ncbi:MAG: LON peptidase substrate-binding domain-containing protein, partial [Syntrophotaleaceae bacterium]
MNDEQDKAEERTPLLDNDDDLAHPEGESGEEQKQEALVLASDVLPPTLPIILLRPRPAFPGTLVPMVLSGKTQLAMAKQAADGATKTIGFVLAKDPEEPDSPDNMYKIGVVGKIMKVLHTDENSIHLLMNCLERFSIDDLITSEKGLFARVTYHFAAEMSVNPELQAYSMAIITALKELVQINPLYSEEIKLFLNRQSMDDPGRLSDFAANLTSSDGPELQQILETFDVRKRIDKVLVLLKKELEVSRLQTKISKQIEAKVSKQQREFFLREQLKEIKKELGLEKEGKTSEIEKFQHRLKKLTLSEEAQKVIDEELEKLRLLEPSSPEYTVSRNYLDWLTVLPWGKFSKDSYDLARARKVLD